VGNGKGAAGETRRRYDNRGREKQAGIVRQRVLDAAERVLVAHGYGATTISAVAQEAGVSRETVHKAYGTKAALVRRLYDTRLVGDEEERPLAGRPEYAAMVAEAGADGVLARYAQIVRGLYGRLGPLVGVLLLAARAGEPDLRDFGAETDEQRLVGSRRIVRLVADRGGLRPELPESAAIDTVWTLNSPDVHHLLTVGRGWSLDEYEGWLRRALVEALLRA
jgi:AcrR family transcriptional regulator